MRSCKNHMNTQRHIEALRKTLQQVQARLAMLESVVPPENRDVEMNRRIREVKIEEAVVLERLSKLGVQP